MKNFWLARTSRARLASAFLFVLLGSCNNKCTGERDDVEPRPAVDAVEVIPAAVLAVPHIEFAVRARLRDEYGGLLADTRVSEVDWQPGSYLTEMGRNVPEIVLKGALVPLADATLPSLPQATKVTATANDRSSSAQITLIATGAAGGMDWAEVTPVSGASPVMALVDGMSGTWRNDTAIAFVGEGALGDYRQHSQGGNSGRVALFSSHHQVGYVDAPWTNGPDSISFSSPPAGPSSPPLAREVLGSPLTVPLRVWIAATGDHVAGSVREDIEYAYRVFRETRSGLTFDTTIAAAFPTSIGLEVVGPGWTCPSSVHDDLVAADVRAFARWQITVAYVTSIEMRARQSPGAVEEVSEPRGYACPADPTHGIILLVSSAAHVHSTLAHELGHALSQWGPPLFGHTNPPTFDASNLMRPFEADNATVSRGRLSLGQSFQMSLDARALVNVSGLRSGKTETCQANADATEPCPRLAKDLP